MPAAVKRQDFSWSPRIDEVVCRRWRRLPMIATVRNAMKVLLLGPVEFRVDGAPVSLGRRRERLIFGALALHAGRVVSI